MLLAQADRGVITGIVTDSQGAAVANATVRVTDSNTGVTTTVATTGSGVYTTPPLIIDTYEVSVEFSGFKKYTAKGILLTSGQTFRQDVLLEVGGVSESVTVAASTEQLNIDNPQVSLSVNQQYYEDLPAVMAGDLRVPEAQLYTMPTFLPRTQGNSYPGSGFFARINGGQNSAYENFLDGASYGEVSAHNATQERSAPYEAIQEARMIENTFSAQYGHTSGGFIEYTTKSGTSEYHGSAYEYLQNNKLNARGEISAETPIVRQNNFGFTLGGPIRIPKIYNGSKKSFFFVNYDAFRYRSPSRGNSYATVPDANIRQGDFSTWLTGQQAGTDACGRAVLGGQIFDPSSTRDASTCGGPAGTIVRDPYPNNQVPTTSQIAKNIVSMIPAATRPGTYANYQVGTFQKYFNATTVLTRLDHNVNDSLHLSLTHNYNQRPRMLDCNNVGGCESPVGYARNQVISTHTAHLQATEMIRPNLFTHAVLSYDRFVMPDSYPLTTGKGWASRMGIKGIPYQDQGGFPGVGFDTRYSGFGNNGGNSFYNTDRWQILDDTTYVFGKHTLKAGFEYRWERWTTGAMPGNAGGYSFKSLMTGAFDANGYPIANTGDPFASFLLGQVSGASFSVPASPGFSRNYVAPWINDDFKVTDRLTLSFGLRFDFQMPRTEKHNTFSTFWPTARNPGADNILGASVFAGRNGTGRSFEKTDTSTYGPRFGFAYRVKENTVVRGGYGIYYAGVVMNQFQGSGTLGFSTNPSVSDLTNGRQAAFFWDDGFPQSAVRLPPNLDPAIANGGSLLYMNPDSLTLPRYQNWTLSVQRRLTQNLLLDVAYVANHGTRLIAGDTLGTLNQNNPNILQKYPMSLLTSDIRSAAAIGAGITPPYASFQGTVAQALRPYPQYQSVYRQNSANGASTYNSLQVNLQKNFSHGLQMRAGYVWSKLLTNGAESGLASGVNGGTPISVYRIEKGLSIDDTPHVFTFTYAYAFPFGKGKRFLDQGGISNFVLGGWEFAGNMRYEAGRPLAIYVNNTYSGVLFNAGRRPDRVPGVSGYLDHNNSSFDIVNSRYIDPAAFTMPAEGTLGTEGAADSVLRGWASYNENVTLFKEWTAAERARVRFGGNFSNLLNRHQWCDPSTTYGDSGFGVVSGQCNSPRVVEFYLRFAF